MLCARTDHPAHRRGPFGLRAGLFAPQFGAEHSFISKIDLGLGTIIIGAEVMCDGANINGACLADVDGEVAGVSRGSTPRSMAPTPAGGGTCVRGGSTP
jgi:hypothetical protein